MQKLSKLILFLFLLVSLHTVYLVSNTTITCAQEAFPSIGFPCDETNEPGPDFHSLRPYQGAACGDANKASYCSNTLKFVESFDLTRFCPRMDHDFDCVPDDGKSNIDGLVGFHVPKHNLYVELDDSMFPIMGNTEEVTNSQGGTEEFDDAQKVNEYASWYLSGVNNRAEYGENTDDRVVNYSGPVQKLLPKMIQEAERIKTIIKSSESTEYTDSDDTGGTVTEPQNHDQIVVCESGGDATACPDGESLRLSDWGEGNLSTLNYVLNLLPFVDKWNKKYPPLPWQFETQLAYQKAYQEWQGKVCVVLPFFGLSCVDPAIGAVDIVPNKWSDLYQYIPLSNTTDKKGVEMVYDVRILPSAGTEVPQNSESYDEANQKSAPLYFAHTQEVKEASELLNKTYIPGDSDGDIGDTSTASGPAADVENNVCSAVNIRTNKGDNLFPGDRSSGEEIVIPDLTYVITQVRCKVKMVEAWDGVSYNPDGTKRRIEVPRTSCDAEATIELVTTVKTPNIEEIFDSTVAGSESTFRRIFPKVGDGAPVTCIADIPTVTNVTYTGENTLTGGQTDFKVENNPIDSGSENPQLTFPHVGSVYEYFLKGIQTALRPKGYGEPIYDGELCASASCGEWESKLEGSGGACGICNAPVGNLAKKILTAAGTAYNVPAANIWAAMKHEGADGYQGTTYDFSDENVRKWSNSEMCGGEAMPGCDDTQQVTQPPFGFLKNWFDNEAGDDTLWSSVQKIDPSRDSREKVSRCNFLDAAFAAANLLSQGSTTVYNGIISCGTYSGFDNSRPGTCSSSYWNDTHVAQSQTVYAGYCVQGPLYTLEQAVGWYHEASCQ